MQIPMDWKNVTTVFLDMDGTLLDLHFDNYFWQQHVPFRFSQKNNIDLEDAKLQLQERYKSKSGTLDWYCIDYWTEDLKLDIAELKREISHRIRIFPYVKEFLESLLSGDKRIILATNAHRESVAIKMNTAQLECYFDTVISSHDFGYSKEEQDFWHKLMEIEPFDPATSLFIDDNLEVLAAAEKFGIEHLISIKQPDSSRPEQDTLHFHAISDFSQIMPK